MGIAFALSVASTHASAISLGRLNVQSALGEPLRAEVEVTDFDAAEADNLKVNIGSPESFKAAGLPYSAALSDIRLSLQKRSDGRYVVRLNGRRSMDDPFIDLLLELNWSSGRIMRNYTVLLDPPVASRGLAPQKPTAPPIRSTVSSVPAVAAVLASTDAPAGRAKTQNPPPNSRIDASAVRSETGKHVTVQRGDTAGHIAATYKPADVSLNQMLVALLHENANAFTDGNVNRIKTGAVLALPSDMQIRAITLGAAARSVKAQRNDFGEYRRHLADKTPALPPKEADALPLTGSRGSLAVTAAGDTPAQSQPAQATASQPVEPSKNPDDAKVTNGSPAVAVAATKVGTASDVPDVGAVPTAPTTPVTTAENLSTLTPGALMPASAAATKPLIAAPTSGLFTRVLNDPWILSAAALVAALIAFLLYRVLLRRRPDHTDSVFHESKTPRDSFFGFSGGQQIDTNDHHLSVVSSLAYSPSQLDSSDIDPVAEADVYLAYGRDLQAEEILREAMRTHPERVAIPLKLLEIHAKRRDLRAFEALISDVLKITGGRGLEWARAVELGRDLDPGNPLYASEAPHATASLPTPVPSQASVTPVKPPAPAPLPAPRAHSVAPLDFDLDMPEATASIEPIAPILAPIVENDFDTAPGILQAFPASESGFIEFDMDSLSNRVSSVLNAPPSHPNATENAAEHPHDIKLSLARELQAFGDTEGAHALVQEVAREGSEEHQIKARQLLAQLDN